jgi:hypothetical protein
MRGSSWSLAQYIMKIYVDQSSRDTRKERYFPMELVYHRWEPCVDMEVHSAEMHNMYIYRPTHVHVPVLPPFLLVESVA